VASDGVTGSKGGTDKLKDKKRKSRTHRLETQREEDPKREYLRIRSRRKDAEKKSAIGKVGREMQRRGGEVAKRKRKQRRSDSTVYVSTKPWKTKIR